MNLPIYIDLLLLDSRVRGAQVFGTLGVTSIFLAAYTGLYFVLSGFQTDGLLHGMATNFLLSFIFYFNYTNSVQQVGDNVG